MASAKFSKPGLTSATSKCLQAVSIDEVADELNVDHSTVGGNIRRAESNPFSSCSRAHDQTLPASLIPADLSPPEMKRNGLTGTFEAFIANVVPVDAIGIAVGPVFNPLRLRRGRFCLELGKWREP